MSENLNLGVEGIVGKCGLQKVSERYILDTLSHVFTYTLYLNKLAPSLGSQDLFRPINSFGKYLPCDLVQHKSRNNNIMRFV